MLDEAASDINAARTAEDGPVLGSLRLPERADATSREATGAPSLDLKLRRADALFASSGLASGDGLSRAEKLSETLGKSSTHSNHQSSSDDAEAPRGATAGSRVLRHGAGVIAIAGLCGLAWVAGAHHLLGRSAPNDAGRGSELQRSAKFDELAGAVRQMSEELRALETRVDAKDAAPKAPSAPAQTTTGKDIADLSSRLDDMDAKLTAKLSRIDGQLAALEQRAPAVHATEVARPQPTHHHAKHLHDAFDPSRDPNAPGAPRPLGSW